MQGISAGGQGGVDSGGRESVGYLLCTYLWGFTRTVAIKVSHKLLQLLPVLTPSCGIDTRISAAASERAGWAVDERRLPALPRA